MIITCEMHFHLCSRSESKWYSVRTRSCCIVSNYHSASSNMKHSATTTWYCIVSHQLNNSQINTLFTPVTMGQGCWLILWGCWPTPQPWTTTITALNYHTSLYSICVANRIKSHLFPATCSSISLPLSILLFLVNRYSQQPINIIFNLKHCT